MPGNREGLPGSLTGLRRDIVVIGASRGGVAALIEIVAALPPGLQSAVLIVLHTMPTYVSQLPAILSRAGPLPAEHGRNGTHIECGRIYVAPPDHHMTVGPNGVIQLNQDPMENYTRPAADPLFRSAASLYGSRVIGIILTGGGSDGTQGLIAVEQAGGLAIVEAPGDALDPGMPLNALLHDNPDLCLPLSKIPGVGLNRCAVIL